jgi:hypothetical protein
MQTNNEIGGYFIKISKTIHYFFRKLDETSKMSRRKNQSITKSPKQDRRTQLRHYQHANYQNSQQDLKQAQQNIEFLRLMAFASSGFRMPNSAMGWLTLGLLCSITGIALAGPPTSVKKTEEHSAKSLAITKSSTSRQTRLSSAQGNTALTTPTAAAAHPMCTVGFFPVARHTASVVPKNYLPTQIKQVKITLPEFYKKQIPAKWLKWADNEVQVQTMRMRSVLSATINHERLSKVLSNPNFSITLTPTAGLPPEVKGKYIPELNTILIEWHSALTEGCLRATLANELYHANVHARNLEIANGKNLTFDEMSYPFFNKNKAQKLEFDKSKLNRAAKAINIAKKRIDALGKLVYKDEATWTRNEQIEWEQYQQVFSDYRQIEICEELPSSYLDEKKFITIRSSEKGTTDNSRFVVFTMGDGKTIKEKMLSFWLEWQTFFNNIYKAHDIYKALPDKAQLNELLSYIEEFPAGVKKFFFKELCDYLSEYMATQANYCEIKTLGVK